MSQKVVGAEWWAFTHGWQANLGHQLHFDTGRKCSRIEWRGVGILRQLLCYLTGAGVGGLTVVFDQSLEMVRADFALVSHLVDDACLFFPETFFCMASSRNPLPTAEKRKQDGLP